MQDLFKFMSEDSQSNVATLILSHHYWIGACHISHCFFYFWKITKWLVLTSRDRNFSRNHITDLFDQFAKKLLNHTQLKSITIAFLQHVAMVTLLLSLNRSEFVAKCQINLHWFLYTEHTHLQNYPSRNSNVQSQQ